MAEGTKDINDGYGGGSSLFESDLIGHLQWLMGLNGWFTVTIRRFCRTVNFDVIWLLDSCLRFSRFFLAQACGGASEIIEWSPGRVVVGEICLEKVWALSSLGRADRQSRIALLSITGLSCLMCLSSASHLHWTTHEHQHFSLCKLLDKMFSRTPLTVFENSWFGLGLAASDTPRWICLQEIPCKKQDMEIGL
jgi:hypothetical protein